MDKIYREFSELPLSITQKNKAIYHFNERNDGNIDLATVDSFGAEWNKFYNFKKEEIERTASEYFDILPPELFSETTYVLDLGCGTGRWTKYLSDKVGFIEAVDPSTAIYAADKLLQGVDNVRLIRSSVENIPFPDNLFDLVISIGVLHHIPDTPKALQNCVNKVKPGGFFYVYLYYNLDNRGISFKLLFWLSNVIRRVVSELPEKIKLFVCDVLAVTLYLPWVATGKLLRRIGLSKIASKLPLSSYHNKSWFVIRANALDRFGTPLEQRFSRKQVIEMMESSGLVDIVVSKEIPFYHAIGRKPK